MRFVFWFIIVIIRISTSILCRIDRAALNQVPKCGSFILVDNHISSIEVPLLFAFLQPRKIVPLAKIETWENKFMGWLFDLWEGIPIRRGEADVEALRRCLAVLKQGKMLAIAPEGTRTEHGQLFQGQPGVVMIGLRSGVPILPIAHWGDEKFKTNLKHLKRTEFHIRVGKPFVLDPGTQRVTGEMRQAMADEIMREIAALLPDEYHGYYRGSLNKPTRFLKYI